MMCVEGGGCGEDDRDCVLGVTEKGKREDVCICMGEGGKRSQTR